MDQLISSFRFRLAGQLGPIIIRLWRDLDDLHISVEYESYLQTPLQAGISAPQPPGGTVTAKAALDSILATLESEVAEAVDAGHAPDASWLVKASL